MKKLMAIVALAAAYAAGASINFQPVRAQTAPGQIWQLGVAGGNSSSIAWRLNTATGFLELCNLTGGTPRCDAMPVPGAGATAPKGLLVPAPGGR
jgi:hypothetical protein